MYAIGGGLRGIVSVCVFALICIRKREIKTKRERRNGLERWRRTSVKHELCKSQKARSEFTEQHAHYNTW